MPARLLRRVLPSRVCCGTRATVAQAMFLMNNNNVDALIVLSSRRGLKLDPIETNFEQLSGIITRSDIFKTAFENVRALKLTRVGRVMTPSYEIITVSTDESVFSCLARMLEKKVHHLLVVRGDRDIVGLVTFKDVVRASLGESEDTRRKCISALAQITDTGLADDEIEEAPAVYAVPKECLDVIMGEDGKTIQGIIEDSQAWVQVLRKTTRGHRFIILDGKGEHRAMAKLMIEQLISQPIKLVSLPLV